jgi:RNA polymerase-binding transcription factor DksA
MMNLTAGKPRRSWQFPWLTASAGMLPKRQVGTVDPASKVQPRQNTLIEKSADVLEEIWRTTDHNRSKATFTLRSGLLRRLKATLGSIKADLFGACLCCKATLGLPKVTATPWTALCLRCQEAANRDDAEELRIRSRG